MYQNNVYYPNEGMYYDNRDENRIGGALGPFILGGITGGLVAPYFRPPVYVMQPRPYPPRPYPPMMYPPRPYPPAPYPPRPYPYRRGFGKNCC